MSRGRDHTHFENLWDYHVNFRERVIYLNQDVDDEMLMIVQKAFDEFEKNTEAPIRIEISSFGGDVYCMFGIIDRIQASPCHVITRGFGKIMSAATLILASGDERIMGANSYFMIHEAADLLRGKTSDLKHEVKHLENMEEHAYRLYEKLSGGKTKIKTFKKLCEKDCYLTAEETLKLGLIDKVL